MKRLVLLLLLIGCSRGTELRECSVGLDDVDLVVDRCSEEYGDWVEDVADRLVVKCVPRAEIDSVDNCMREGVDGCTVRLGNVTGNLGEPTGKSRVVAADDVSVSRLLCHEIPAHWRDGELCGDHSDVCYDDTVKAFEIQCKDGIE